MIRCLRDNGYVKGNKIYKKVKSNIVLDVKKGDNTYVAKVLFISRTDDEMKKHTMDTEIQALKYFNNLPFFPRYVDDFECDMDKVVIMEKINGDMLENYKNKNLSKEFWDSLIYQLVVIIFILEDNRILHNDFWDANILIVKSSRCLKIKYGDRLFEIPAGIRVKVIDFQYTNQYQSLAAIRSEYVMTRKKEFQQERKRIGWSHNFHKGGDLNQMLGLLSEYKSIPQHYKQYIDKHVIVDHEAEFPYAIQKSNRYMTGERLLKEWFQE